MIGWTELLLGALLSLALSELTEVSPWAARKLVRWAAYRWTTDPELAAAYAEEWAAIIDERPGKLLKLLTATGFTLGATGRAAPRMLLDARRRINSSINLIRDPRVGDALSVLFRGIAIGLAALGAALKAFDTVLTATMGTVTTFLAAGVMLMALAQSVTVAIMRTSCRAIVRPKRRY
ncbi:hypothetical protein ACFY03_20335 [Micromonospora chersina]|uniref:hypothetical protein n=1 Tax=Micromonospora chersina TaxID=47854 RepID=UPI0036CEBE75